TENLCSILKKYHPLYFNMHFNHPAEITPEVEKACAMLADAGIPLGSQTVLLKGVNDNSEVMKELMLKLLKNRIKPYYIYQADMTEGTDHFRTSVQKGLDILKDLMGHTSGMAVPYFVIDAPGGGGKVRLLPNSVVEHNKHEVVITNYEGKVFRYQQSNGNNGSSSENSKSNLQKQDMCQLPA
ncbi:MAG: lysine 2,3-aminomutase, partial [Nitrospina sp.]|nr:lysine 2,3-aminomutase [Nitrospina sp.]